MSVDKIAGSLAEAFPKSGLSKVGRAIADETRDTIKLSQELIKPLWLVRVTAGVLTVLALIWPLLLAPFLKFKETFNSLGDFMEATDAGLHVVLVFGAGIIFLVSLETRIKRGRALRSLVELRSLAHIIDMHQITKDPQALMRSDDEGALSSVTSDAELAVYLDFCSDLLSIIGKLAAYHVQYFQDRVVLDAVTEIETLTNGLSRNLWQKIMIINHMAEVAERSEKQVDL